MAESKRAWQDEDDARAAEATPAFLKQSHQTPAWAVTDAKRERLGEHSGDEDDEDARHAAQVSTASRKRYRNEDLDALLSKTEPLLSAKHDRQRMAPPSILSTLPLPRDAARTINWQSSGQVCVVGGNHHLYTFHAAGKFVEQLSKIDVVKRVEQTALLGTEDVLVTTHEAYMPLMVSLTSEKVLPLKFLDTRDSAVYRNGRRDNSKRDFFVKKCATDNSGATAGASAVSSAKLVAVASGSTVRLGSIASGSVVHAISVDNPVSDAEFTGPHQLTIASGSRLAIYDVRKTSRFLFELVDEGALQITSFAVNRSSIAIGSAGGVVSVYDRQQAAAAAVERSPVKPTKVLKNLTTAISHLSFGIDSNGEEVMAFSSKGQKAAFRLAQLPQFEVIPSFPAVSTRHQFAQSLLIAPTVPILSVGERGRVVNYAL